jgi:hypothetical protein
MASLLTRGSPVPLTAADRTLQQHDGKLLISASLLSGVSAKITEGLHLGIG